MSGDLAAELAAAQAELARLRQVLATSLSPTALAIGTILAEVADEFGVKEHLLRADMREHRFTKPRQAVMALTRQLTGRSYATIGRILRRDHTTVCSGCRAHERHMAADPTYAARVRAVSERLQGRLTHVGE